MTTLEPTLRKAWMAEALAELKGRRRMSNTDIARALGKSRQAFHLAITRDVPSEQLVYDMAKAFPDLPRPGEAKVIQMNRDGVDERMDRMERALNAILAALTMLSAEIRQGPH